jgi:hypothetical protein
MVGAKPLGSQQSFQAKSLDFVSIPSANARTDVANLRRREWNRSCLNSGMEPALLRDLLVLKEQI